MMRRATSNCGLLVYASIAMLAWTDVATGTSIAAPLPAHERSRDEGRQLAGAGRDEAALEAWRRAYGQVPEGPQADVDRTALMLEIGRAEYRLYETSREPAYLRRAAAALRFCMDHRDLLPEAERETVATELAEVERKVEEIDGPATEPSPALDPAPSPPIAVQPAPPNVTAPPPALPPDPGLERARKTASGVGITGAVFAGVGGAAWVLLALPAELAAQVAEDRAADDPVLVSQSELQSRADNRREFARTTFWVGLGCVGAGVVMLGVGFGTKAKIERDMQRSRAKLSFTPIVSPREVAGALTLRF